MSLVRLGAFVLILMLSASVVQGQRHNASDKTKKVKIVPLPALFYTPETKLGYGALVSGLFTLGDTSTTRSSNVQVLGAYTLNKQIILQTNHNIFSADERFNYNGELSYYDFPILYYGVGNDTEKANEENLEYQVIILRERVVKQVKPDLFLGGQYRITSLYGINYHPDILADSVRIYDGAGTNSGLGLALLWDARDNVLNARSGSYAELSNFIHGGALGGTFRFNRYRLDMRNYHSFKNGDVLAGQIFGEFNTGAVPFREMAL